MNALLSVYKLITLNEPPGRSTVNLAIKGRKPAPR
jgi:hypothetical protein